MNKNDREEISKLISELEDITSRIVTLRDAEQEKFDNMTEGLQQTERGQAMEAAVSSFDDAIGDCENARSNLESAME